MRLKEADKTAEMSYRMAVYVFGGRSIAICEDNVLILIRVFDRPSMNRSRPLVGTSQAEGATHVSHAASSCGASEGRFSIVAASGVGPCPRLNSADLLRKGYDTSLPSNWHQQMSWEHGFGVP